MAALFPRMVITVSNGEHYYSVSNNNNTSILAFSNKNTANGCIDFLRYYRKHFPGYPVILNKQIITGKDYNGIKNNIIITNNDTEELIDRLSINRLGLLLVHEFEYSDSNGVLTMSSEQIL